MPSGAILISIGFTLGGSREAASFRHEALSFDRDNLHEEVRFVEDWLMEQAGFELPAPPLPCRAVDGQPCPLGESSCEPLFMPQDMRRRGD